MSGRAADSGAGGHLGCPGRGPRRTAAARAGARERLARPSLLLGARRVQALRLPLLRRARPGRARRAWSRRPPDGSEDPDPEAEGERRRSPIRSRRAHSPASPALALGNAVHAALEWSARSGGRPRERTAWMRCSASRAGRRRRGAGSGQAIDRGLAGQRPLPCRLREGASARGAVRPAAGRNRPSRQHRPPGH